MRPAGAALTDAIREAARGKIAGFYKSRDYEPLWIERGLIGTNAQAFLRILDSAALDGLNPSRYRAADLRNAIAAADSGDPRALARAETELSKAFVRYVADVRRAGPVKLDYAEPRLAPRKPGPETILRVAALSGSFRGYMTSMGWMSPHYVRMRALLAVALSRNLGGEVVRKIRLNRERARLLPPPSVRHIVVDSGSARLWYYQAGKEAGTMRVVVGAFETQTPVLAGALNYAVFNPYWNIPDYLARDNVARKILAGRTLDSMHMEALSDWSDAPQKIPASSIDWHAVASGELNVRLRELPGPVNSMGKVKFVFPNDEGIYLHDTPNRDLFAKADRHLSNGCIRLEKAEVLSKWLLGNATAPRTKAPEQAVPLPVPVPVYLTYFTVAPGKDGVEVLNDVYALDGPALKKVK